MVAALLAQASRSHRARRYCIGHGPSSLRVGRGTNDATRHHDPEFGATVFVRARSLDRPRNTASLKQLLHR
jgi:hypothetical protein